MSSPQPSLRGKFSTPPRSLKEQCDKIIASFEESNDIVQAGRNTLKKIHFQDSECVIKSFRKPSFPQNYSYGLIAKSKAYKSYHNAKKLNEMGFLSPTPVGYFEYRVNGKLTNSYYLCNYESDTETLHTILEKDPTLESDLIQQFAEYAYKLHDHGVLHRDFNPKNILISKKNDQTYTFSLVDINRITWYSKLSLQQSMHSLSRLPFNESTKKSLLTHYASVAQTDLDQCLTLLNKSEAKTRRYFRNKKRFRQIFPKRKK